jgi:hypothetical protein
MTVFGVKNEGGFEVVPERVYVLTEGGIFAWAHAILYFCSVSRHLELLRYHATHPFCVRHIACFPGQRNCGYSSWTAVISGCGVLL